MLIVCLQFAPQIGKVEENISRANALLQDASADIDLLVLPEMAFSGYNFPSLEAIRPFLEPKGAGPSSIWAKATAARLQCIVSVGYPEVVLTANGNKSISPSICYNSTITVSQTGDILANYRKTHLYYTDETWAQESDTKWLTVTLPLNSSSSLANTKEGSHNGSDMQGTRATFGICMDLNPYQFTAPWTLYELASFTLNSGTHLLLLSMAWLTRLTTSDLLTQPGEPDLETLTHWVERLFPLVKNQDREVIVVFANRHGEEHGNARYAGSSWIGKVGLGNVKVWGILGKAEERLLAVDTDQYPEFVLQTSRDDPF